MKNSGSDAQCNFMFNSNRQSNESLFAIKTPFNTNRQTFPNGNGMTPMNQNQNTPINTNSMPMPMNMNHNPSINMNHSPSMNLNTNPVPMNQSIPLNVSSMPTPMNQNMNSNPPMNGYSYFNSPPLNLGKMGSMKSNYPIQNQNNNQINNQQLIIDDYLP